MNLPNSVPDWLPWWAVLIVLLPAAVWLLALLVMPFNVFGVKGRLDVIEARLDEIQGEIRSLALRLPEHPEPAAPDRPGRPAARPPIPPAPVEAPRRFTEPPTPPPRALPPRAEPRLDWPR